MTEQINYMPENLRIGHTAIDAQHEVLYALYNELTHSLQHKNNIFALADIFPGLNMYITTHFQYEEEAMLATHYNGMEEHCKEHGQLAEGVGELYVRFTDAKSKEEEKSIAQDIAVFLSEWLSHHIAEIDRKLSQFLNEHPTS